ncbi:MAG: ATP-binding cassette domain-containing protein [Chloroflexi bacterium]|jgi:ABC-2 type transport system ATP-binding protein|nr:ATP-binding cassette domain-containing protein [Chloroflexota bacterium]MBT7080745.1 ATP-binding cassette domain-containing protein [Chloroflexota bacterium]
MTKKGEIVVKTENLTKHFGPIVAVDNLNIEVRKGEVFGFLGPNGAGKSTTMGMMLGLIAPTAGKAELFGLDVQHNLPSILPKVGAMMEVPGLYPYLSGWDNLSVFARLSKGITDNRIEEVLKLVDLTSRASDKFGSYSTGMKQRLAIACALLHNPEIVILDEPANGLDPAGQKEIRELIIKLGKEGKTVFLNSHVLHEVELVCERVCIIKRGKVVVEGLVKELINTKDVLQIKVNETEKAVALLRTLDWISSVNMDGDYIALGVNPDRAAEVSAALAAKGVFATEIKAKEGSLEQFFLEQTEEEAIV